MTKFDSSYDRAQARAAASRLAAQTTHVTLPRPATSAPADPTPAWPPAPPVRFDDRDVYRDQVWRLLLEWARDTTAAQGAFVCDTGGLVIAEAGAQLGLEDTLPSVLVAALSKLRRVSPTQAMPRHVLVALEPCWAAALTLPEGAAAGEDGLILGLLCTNRPQHDALTHVARVFGEKLAAPAASTGA